MAQKSTTVYPNKIHPREWTATNSVSSSQKLFERSCPKEASRSKRIIRSSFESTEINEETSIFASSNGLVKGIFYAYCDHHNLVIRPEDVWFAILTQLSFYINANAEKLRSHFVSHEGRKEIEVREVDGTIDTVDIGAMAVRLTQEMNKYLVDPDLRDWVMPNFTTTTEDDEVTAAVLMMGSMQQYFSYRMVTGCGIPSIKLLGDEKDWVSIRERLDKLASFGKESQSFGQLLIPVLDNFIRSYNSPNDVKLHDFWNKICSHRRLGSGRSDQLSGWVTAFCFWDENGRMLYRPDPKKKSRSRKDNAFDSSIYHNVDTDSIPAGTVSVPVKFDDWGTIYQTRMVAGSVGMELTSSGKILDESPKQYDNGEDVESKWKPQIGNRTGLDTLQPVSGWWMYELKNSEQKSTAN